MRIGLPWSPDAFVSHRRPFRDAAFSRHGMSQRSMGIAAGLGRHGWVLQQQKTARESRTTGLFLTSGSFSVQREVIRHEPREPRLLATGRAFLFAPAVQVEC